LRLTVWQNLIIPDIDDRDLDRIKEAVLELGLDWKRSSIRAGLVACTGSAGCKYGGADTKKNAIELAEYLDERFELDQPINIHFTGCHHSCAQHTIGDIGLIATKVEHGEELIDGYHILVGGRTGLDCAIGLKVVESVPSNLVPSTIETLIDCYLQNRKSDESFADFSKHTDWSSYLSPLTKTPYRNYAGVEA
jgi:ferredoxin-nitrite reductase